MGCIRRAEGFPAPRPLADPMPGTAPTDPGPTLGTGEPVDLHAHTTTSDGTLTPRELVARAQKAGLRALAVTDHDHVGGIAPAREAADGTDLEVVAGIEFSVDHGPRSFHLLGYAFDPGDGDLAEAVREVQDYRARRNPRMIRKLQDEGVDVTLEEVEAYAAGDLVGRPHMARALVDRGVVDSVQEAFDAYLGEGARAYLPKKRLPSTEAVDLLHGAGGVAVMAHPVTVGEADAVEEVLDDLGGELDGLEVVHSKHGPPERARFARMADERDLVPTGGSDFHGENKPDVDLATGRGGNVDVRHSTLQALRDRAQRYR